MRSAGGVELANLVWDNREDPRNTAEFRCLGCSEMGGEAIDGAAISIDKLGGVGGGRQG